MFATPRSGRTVLVLACLILASSRAEGQERLQYNRDIRPLLADACFKCHGPAARKGGLRLDVREDAVKPTRSKTVPIVAGKPEASELIRRLGAGPDEVMPPPSAHRTLTPAEKDRLKRWIAEGASYQKHWAFETPVKVAVPKQGLANPIDAFIAERLAREGVKLAGEADRPTLIRRAAFALTGLPPTPTEVDAFLADRSADAYERMIDRYLASRHFGEEMARHWLDGARYADTHGLHLDNERQMWLYRDWVVQAFNANLPFDRFTIEQLAGDLLPNPTKEQLTATGFNRCNVTTSEGGSIESEWVYRNAVDRTSTMMEVWLGLTGGCAVCHDHKFDPISSKEYYSLYAFFHSAGGPALDGNKLLTEPVVKMATPEHERKLSEFDRDLARVKQELTEKVKTITYHDPATESVKSATPANDGGKSPAPVQPGADKANTNAMAPSRSFQVWVKQGGGKDAKTLPQDIKTLLKQVKAKADPASEKRLRDYYLEFVCADTKPVFTAITQKLTALTKARTDFDNAIPGTFIFKELPQPRDSFVMMRGHYDKPGDKVEPNTPSILPPLKKAGARANRLDLANWLVSPEHPLTGRVAVNRFWQQIFGTGLVKSSADFGTQGELPSHPELLDYLAVHFRETGWDVKALTRLIVTSATFRQDSRVPPALLKRDPENRLLGRGPRLRLDGEQIRDNALFVSGLISLEMGGRGVRPYQPPRIWEPVAFSGSNTMNYTQDKGSGLYRRSLYTFLKRTAPPPYLANFDAPNRESPCSRRERSNTPLQALQLMNDVQHFEAARAFAQRMLTEGGKTPAERIRFAYKVVLSRLPETQEVAVVENVLKRYQDRYAKDPEAAKQAIRVGESTPRAGIAEPELAAYTLIANLLLNLDETITRN